MVCTCDLAFLVYMILFSMSQRTEGLVCGMLRSAVRTRWAGSWMKCFAVLVRIAHSLYSWDLTRHLQCRLPVALYSGYEGQSKFEAHDAVVHNASQK